MQRNGNKRYSGVFDPQSFQQSNTAINSSSSSVPTLIRRTSKKGSNKDRQGHVYGDDEIVQGALNRPMTPDPSTAAPSTTEQPSSSFGSPSSDLSTPQSSSLVGAPRSQALRFESTRDRYIADADGKSRPRTRTLDERARKTSFENKVRNRMGSMHAITTGTQSPQPIDTSSIGFPSIMSGSPAAQQRRPTMSAPSRPLSPVNDTVAVIPPGLPSPNNDTARILHLMRTTSGRMHGILFFRMKKTGPWSSGYCAINVASGTLIYQMKGDVSHAKTLIPDLRGCTVRTQVDPETNTNFLEIASRTSDFGVHLRPHVPETFESWLAALLCWQPLSPKQTSASKSNTPAPTTKPTIRQAITNPRRNSSINLLRDAAIIKVGKMLYWDKDIPPSEPSTGAQRISTYKQQRSASGTPWTKISCTLQENGLLKLYREPETTLIHQIPLSALNRFAIQRLHPTVLEDEYCLAIYPQYRASNTTALDLTYPIFLSLETRILFEVWFVLLRAFTTPELYGPEQPSARASVDLSSTQARRQISSFDQLFRVERVLSLRIVEAKIYASPQENTEATKTSGRTRGTTNTNFSPGDYHAEALIDGEVRGRTAVKSNTGNPFWREDYDFYDLPPVISSAAVHVKSRSPGQKDWYSISDSNFDASGRDLDNLGAVSDIRVSPLDVAIGTVKLQLDDFERGKEFEQWWNLLNDRNEITGEILMKIRIEEAVVLMSRHYEAMSEMLHRFSSGLTQQIAFAVPLENRKLHETLLSVFQYSGHASDWLMSLVEDEIDGIHKDTPAPRYRYSRRIASNDSYDSGVERELILRDAGKNATQEANLLFRGNSLLTKALDFYMRRLGKEYLDETLGERIRDIDESDPDCEVDPNRIKQRDDLQRNWRNLIALTESVWIAIKTQPSRCPPELRAIFRHIRACADDRYGNFLRNIKYSSVSGFLFLRFFCPAVLNPKLFGLLKDHPRPRALRTLTFIAKSLQCLANLSTFGNKEHWMEPMNQFINSHRQEFKDYIDQICTISSDQSASRIPPSYATPLTILSRLPPTAREGFPSLPYLIDQPRELASLTNTWIEATGDSRPTEQDGEDIAAFDRLCYTIREQTKATISRALRADQPSGAREANLEELAENYDRQSRRSVVIGPGHDSTRSDPRHTGSNIGPTGPVAALTRAARRLRMSDGNITNSASNSSQVSLQSNREGPVSPVVSHPGTGGRSSPWAPSPATSAAHSVSGWDPSETESSEQFPTHAISWDKSSLRNGKRDLDDTESVEADSDDAQRAMSSSKRPENINTTLSPPGSTALDSGGSGKLAFSMSTSTYEDKSPVSPREGGRKFTDVWNFRRKDKDKDKDRSNASSDQQGRHDESGSSSNKRGTLTKKERERGKRDQEKDPRGLPESQKNSKDHRDESKGKGKNKK